MGRESNNDLMAFFALAIFSLYLSSADSFNEYRVPCGTEVTACECPFTDENGTKIDVCLFSLRVRLLQTFTRYRVDPSTGLIATYNGGKVWYIDETTSEYLPFPDENSVCSIPLNDTSCTQPFSVDGKTFRSLVTVNGQFPGPSLIVHHNQTVVVNVTNLLESQTVSIHWHGIHQIGTNWMDGVDQVTQCGIAPGNIFTYIFRANPSGTFWYHSHIGSKRADGLLGALIIREADAILNNAQKELGKFEDFPDQHTLLLQDFFKSNYLDYRLKIHSGVYLYNSNQSPDPSYTPAPHFTYAADGSGIGGIPFWSALINGRGRYPGLSYSKTRLSVFTVSPSHTYRFRIIGASTRYPFRFSIDEHKLVVISTDGVLLKPTDVDFLFVHGGERYDVLVSMMSKLSTKTDYIIRAETVETVGSTETNKPRWPLKGHLAEAILHYNLTTGKPSSTQYSAIAANSIPVDNTCSIEKPCVALNCLFKSFPSIYNITCIHVHQLKLLNPLPDSKLPSVVPDEYMFLNLAFEGSSRTSSVNARKLKLPFSPLSLLTEYELQNAADYCEGIDDPTMCKDAVNETLATECMCTYMKNISSNVQSVQLVLSNVSPGYGILTAHPTHIHGHYI